MNFRLTSDRALRRLNKALDRHEFGNPICGTLPSRPSVRAVIGGRTCESRPSVSTGMGCLGREKFFKSLLAERVEACCFQPCSPTTRASKIAGNNWPQNGLEIGEAAGDWVHRQD